MPERAVTAQLDEADARASALPLSARAASPCAWKHTAFCSAVVVRG